MTSARSPTRSSRSAPSALVAHPFTAGDRRARGIPATRRSRRSTATRSAAGSSSRSPATCASRRDGIKLGDAARRSSASSTRTPGCAASSTRSARARTRELFLLGRDIDAAHRARLGARQPRRASRASSAGVALELAARARGQRAALPARQQARDRARCSRAERELAPDVEQELIELRRASLLLARTCARGCAPSPRSAAHRAGSGR